MSRWLARLVHRLGIEASDRPGELRIAGDDWRRIAILLLTCVLCAAVVVDYARAPTEALRAGDVAPRTVKAPFTFKYADQPDFERRRDDAGEAVLPVFVHRVSMVAELEQRIADAFEGARRARLGALAQASEGPSDVDLSPEQRAAIVEEFLSTLDVHLPSDEVNRLADAGFPVDAQQLAKELLRRGMQFLIIKDRESLPPDRRGVRVIELGGDGSRDEHVMTDLEQILTPHEARQQITLGVFEAKAGTSAAMDSAATVARALVRSNLSFDPLQTQAWREQAMASVQLELQTVKRGAILFRAGDTLSEDQVQVYRALQEHHSEQDLAKELVAIGLFLVLLLVSLYQFGSVYLDGFSTRVRDVGAVGAVLVVTAFLARIIVASSEGVATMVGYEAEPRSIWFVVPVAGAAMLVRLLLGVAWTVVFSVAAATICGLVMGLQALPMVFFLISGVAAAGAVEHTRERIAVLRAGVYVGVVNAACVLLIHFVQLYVAEGELSLATTMRPFWSMGFAMLGGVLSSILVLGLVPLFESIGFMTDYRLMELANLNHPLLRQLMLRAPGSYHHSVVVGTLAEAGCEAIGANALLAKVASYFHDVGKSLKPQYFVENQRDDHNKHVGLDPNQSARIIISHVTDGGRMAREYNLPQPILDNIYMHHGTGILQYFFAAAVAEAEDPDAVDESAFRYPGPKPNTRESGVIMLADKVEAATRTIRAPDEQSIRAMISRIVSSVIADGQFSECPLTLQEIQTVADTFVKVLLGIYHQRIEYPQTAEISAGHASVAGEGRAAHETGTPTRVPAPPRHAVITLDLDRPRRAPRPEATPPRERAAVVHMDAGETASADEETSDAIDYESVEHLPRGD